MQSRKFWVSAVAVALLAVWAAPAPAAQLLAAKGAGRAEAEKWMLDDAEVVFIVNVKQMLASDLMKQGGTQHLQGLLKSQAQASKALESIGLDPFKDVDGLLVTGSGASSPKDAKVRVVVRGNFDTAKIQAAAEKVAKDKPDELKITKDGSTQLYQIKGKGDDQTMFGAFADRSTLVLTNTREGTLDTVKSGGKNPARIKDGMKSALDKFSGKETVAAAVAVTEEMKKQISKVPQVAALAPKLQTITAAVTLTDAAELNVVANTSDPKAAEQLQKVLSLVKATGELMVQNNEDLPPIAGELISAVQIKKDNDAARLDLKVTKEMIEKATKKKKD